MNIDELAIAWSLLVGVWFAVFTSLDLATADAFVAAVLAGSMSWWVMIQVVFGGLSE